MAQVIDWDAPDLPLAPIEQLHAEAELLRLVERWREKHEKLAYEKRFRIKRWLKEQRDYKS